MYIHVDTGQVPPVVELREPDNFTTLKAVVVTPSHVWIDPATLAELSGRSEDENWCDRLTQMVTYADSNGWTDEHGRLRAHIDTERPTDDPQQQILRSRES